jgi:DNA-binding transcriptional regulator YhcF (GntR family)
VAAAPVVATAGSLAERAYYAIRDRIVSLELSPGAVIDERALIEALGIGRTPIREALRRLAQEKLVEVYPRRGMFVTGVDVRDLARLSEVRAVLESEAARLAAKRASELERDELGTLIGELHAPGRRSGPELVALDERIHRRGVLRARAAHLVPRTRPGDGARGGGARPRRAPRGDTRRRGRAGGGADGRPRARFRALDARGAHRRRGASHAFPAPDLIYHPSSAV